MNKPIEIEWSKELVIGVPVIDSQHKQIYLRLNELIDTIAHEGTPEKAGKALVLLGKCVNDHFLTEERFMRRYNYPGYDSHNAEHSKFSSYYEILKKDYILRICKTPEKTLLSQSGLSLDTVIKSVLVSYWRDHIPSFDKPMAEYLRTKMK